MSSPEGAQTVQLSFVFFFSKALHRWLQLFFLWDTVMLFPLECLSKWSPDSLKTWWGEEQLWLLQSGHRQLCGSKRQSRKWKWGQDGAVVSVWQLLQMPSADPPAKLKYGPPTAPCECLDIGSRFVEMFLTCSPKCLYGWNIAIVLLLITDVSHPGSV